jgi:hypothetical protein|tara:strand:+ start:1277 stop:1411 length:135 start_codon:yes stop_codon:yes gene_type:complete
MNRILFVGLCLVGIIGVVLVNPNSDFEKESKKEIAKEHYEKTLY